MVVGPQIGWDMPRHGRGYAHRVQAGSSRKKKLLAVSGLILTGVGGNDVI